MTKAEYYRAAGKARTLAKREAQRRKAENRHSVSLATFYSRDTVEALARESASRGLKEALAYAYGADQ